MKRAQIKELKVKEFFKLSVGKILVDISLSALVLAVFFTSMAPLNQIFGQLSLEQKIIDIAVNLAFFSLIFYPLSCFLALLMKRKRA